MPTEQVLVARAAGRLLEERERLIASLVRVTRAQISALDHDAASRSLLEASITENIVAAMNFLQQGIDAQHLEAPTAALAYARMLAQRDVPLSALIRAYRIGHSTFLDTAFTVLDDLPAEDRLSLVVALVRRSAQFIDLVCEQVGRTYELERERWVASQSGVRQQWVNELLGGGPVDRAAAERALRYPLDAVHVACTLWPVGQMSSFDLVSAVEEVRARAVSVLRARACLVVPTDELESRLWFALPARADDGLQALAPPDGVFLHAAIGRPGADLAGFRTSARQAGRVKEIVAARLGRPGDKDHAIHRPVGPRWVPYDDVAPIALMAGDLEAVREFVTVTLGDLAQSNTRNAMLRETLQAFLTHHRSYAATAEVMNLHRNSIQYRVQHATALLPEAAESLEDDYNVRTALLAAQWLGGPVLF
ncbi:PucR family transcriptional regulator [Streptomyces sp. GQFP]|uniref:PucR family transcriptional regulator n=1 Tax=Streptomyces sp. GQFP TaxID=2907545 RepID=UPI001F3FC24A|nr:helix-turn-helix domain-containing protein [Streptomyces sp. GQFP]UIX32788.1 helix-turn-helix domain-containing protein [Streptomyces sp. GQFP]